ncbi:MAG: ion transporter [Muribaculaceae bacterium]|nr:ion transporter [Muribaculaceae bacterium]
MSENKTSEESLKIKLARALDDNLHTRQWHNIVDWLIIAMILISTTEIFLSTFDLDPKLRRILFWVDIVTLVFFTVEVVLRIWVAPIVNPKFKGWKGRLKYCCTFYGAIDVLATFPFYLQWLFPLPVLAFKALRTARVVRTIRIGRYTKSFNLLTDAIREKRHELIVAMQFLIVITVILSLILFFAEHDAQPDVYDNGAVSVLWAFAQYIGDPGQFADTPPVTLVGRIIACIVGLLGIAIVAVPTGIIGAGFTDAIENRNHKEEVKSDADMLRNGFERKLDRPTGLQVVPPYRSVEDLKSRLNMKTDNLQEAVNHGPGFRIINLAETIPTEEGTYPMDRIAVEHYPQNTVYGCCIDRGSRLTIVAPSNMIDPGLTHFCFYLAYIGRFNYISREVGAKAPYRSYYTFKTEDDVEGLKEYIADLQRLMARDGAWSLTVLVASGALEPPYPTNVHMNIGGPKGDARTSGDALFVKDGATYEAFYNTLEKRLSDDFGLTIDHQKYHNTHSPNHSLRKISFGDDANNMVMRIEWKYLLWSQRRIQLARTIAECLCTSILHTDLPPLAPELEVKAIGYDGYDIPAGDVGT